jgi:hypothetical protein
MKNQIVKSQIIFKPSAPALRLKILNLGVKK